MIKEGRNNRGHQLHCGACMTDFEEIEALNTHLESCPAAEAMLLPIYKLHFAGESSMGHPLGHLIYSIHKNAHLLKRYAHAIATELGSLERAKLHYEICEKLDLDYNKFRPFEAETITAIPTSKEAEAILYAALGEELIKL